ncbi:dihydrolipoyl dehydrogenase [Candidatus Woesearchaeota archaeon]|nr:dihydrolipoyl dehydrogenase [Candidatus Woesearchaeota archaeon]
MPHRIHNPKHYDVIVIGSGGGLVIAVAAAQLGLKAALIEKGKMGGTCLNRGCIPSKMLIYPAEVTEYITGAEKFGIHASKKYTADFKSIITRISRTIDTESRSIDPRSKNLDVYRHEARFVEDKTLLVRGTHITATHITADRIFIAAGARPQIPTIKGLKGTPYMTSTDALRNTRLPKKMIVIGGGYIAAELGYAYQALGSDVHFLVRSGLLGREDKDIRFEFTRVFTKHHHVHLGWNPTLISYKNKTFSVVMENGRKKKTLSGDALLVATGVVPNSDALGLDKTNIKVTKSGFIETNSFLETSVPGVYALGDIAGKYLFRHSVNFEAEHLIQTLFIDKKKKAVDYGPMPHAIFTHPQIASLGMTEDQLLEQGKQLNKDYVVGLSKYADCAMGAARRSDHGFVKLIADATTGKLLGCHMIGEEASGMIHMVISLMYAKRDATVHDLLNMVYIHPALPEVVRNAARAAEEQLLR